MTDSYANLRKYDGGEHGYILEVNGRDVRLTFKELWAHRRLRLRVFVEHNRLLTPVKQREWDSEYLRDLIERMTHIPLPAEWRE